MPGAGLVHAGEDLDDVPGRRQEADRAREAVLLRGLRDQRHAGCCELLNQGVERGIVVGLERDVVKLAAIGGDVHQRVVAIAVGQVGGSAVAAGLAEAHDGRRPGHRRLEIRHPQSHVRGALDQLRHRFLLALATSSQLYRVRACRR